MCLSAWISISLISLFFVRLLYLVLIYKVKNRRIPIAIESAHLFLCDPESYLRESVYLCFIIVSFASEVQ